MFAEKLLGYIQLYFRQRDHMQAPKGTLFVLPLLLVLGCGAPIPAPELTVDPVEVVPPAGCAPVGNIRFICNLISPEDLAVIPGEEWVIASGNQQGGKIHLVSVRDKTTSVLFPNSSPREEFDATSYPNCPGPIDPSEGEAFRAHGLYLTPGTGTIHKMFLVHHGSRESIEVFEIDSSGTSPVLTWVGCAVAPEAIRLNSVVGFPAGGFAATSFRSQDKPASSREDVLAGMVSGSVWEWHTESGWIEVPGSDTSGPNGLEISSNGQWFYIAGWGSKSFIRLSRGQVVLRREAVELHFRPDNLRMQEDGSVFAAGANLLRSPEETFHAARIDPEMLTYDRLIDHPAIDKFPACTTAMQVGGEIWMGTNRGEKIGYFPVP